MEDAPILWQPSDSFRSESRLATFRAWLREHRCLQFPDYEALWEWSVTDTVTFWDSIAEFFEVRFHDQPRSVLRNTSMPGSEWFAGGTLNYAEHIFRHQTDVRPALLFQAEGQAVESVSWAALSQQVAAIQAFLRERGIGMGDRVAAYLPNTPVAIACFLAVNGVGAVWSCCSPDFGVSTVIDRFSQIEPKLLFAVDGYRYNGKAHDRQAEVDQIRTAIASIETTVIVPYLQEDPSLEGVRWNDVLATKATAPSFVSVPFSHPIWVLYSSGTTGKPKAITHSHGGVLLEHLKYLAFHNDTKAGEHFFWFTTTGWMMWNFLQASMLVGAVPVLYDGSPGYPNLNALWKLAAELPIHHFGTSAPYLTACMKRELQPGADFGLSSLRSIGSTGAPLPPEAFDWIYESVSKSVWLCSMSGGTDVCTAFVGGVPFKPVRRGRIQGRALGCALYAYSETGQRLTGELGEMVIEKPMPSMPIFFWNDAGGKRYHASYFADFPGKWRHGDWIELYEDGSLIIQGRSDATLNRKGIRIGTAEIYSVLDGIAGLQDSLIINLEKEDGEDFMPLFVVLAEGQSLDEPLRQTINEALRSQCSPRHVPDAIYAVPDIPYTLSGKKMEVPVKKILLGMDISRSLNQDALRNPEALDYFLDFPEVVKW
ncbi:MAG: acetoacetate--CoA ligase [Lewinella sp.]|nr:acetoacetate--CoA ligase [Lewinella sp.]